MKKIYSTLASAILLVAFCSCEKDAPTENSNINATDDLNLLSYQTDGVWNEADYSADFTSNGFTFSHSLSEYNTIEGFTPAKCHDNSLREPLYQYQFDIMPDRNENDLPYIVGFWTSREGDDFQNRSLTIAKTDNSLFTPVCIDVTNTCYAYYTMRDGNAFSKKFEKGDWFRLTAHGLKADNSEIELSFYLAYCDSDDAQEGLLKSWKTFDLSELGEVKGIYFTMSSSDTGEFGMNTPSYFAISNFMVK